jgi:orotidine-5'-phosphate decarboxylase
MRLIPAGQARMAEIIVALDLPTHTAALGLVDELGDAVSWYKVGSPLFTRSGPAVVRQLRDRGRKVFLDLKFHDIPSTVAHAVESAAALDVQMLTLHASGGPAMLQAAAAAVGDSGPRLLGVTVLTSLGAPDLANLWRREIPSVQDEVLRLASMVREAGLHGVVASPLETRALRAASGPDFLIINPGIRPVRGAPEDQVRTATPAGAVQAGADYLVVGRPILEAEDRTGALERILADLADTATLSR